MKYHDKSQFIKILELQRQARAAHQLFEQKLTEADQLVAELKEEYGDTFVCNGNLFGITNSSNCLLSDHHTRDWIIRKDVRELT